MPEKDNQLNSFEAIKLSAINTLKKGLAISGSVIAMSGAILENEAIFPDKAQAETVCTTTTSTTVDGTTQTTTETTTCTDSPAVDSPASTAENPTKPDKPIPHHPHKPDKHAPKSDKNKDKKANSQKGFLGYNMEDSAFTDGNGCFITAAASALRRETGNAHITPKKIYYPELHRRWSPSGGVNGFLFDALPAIAARHNVAVYDTGFKGLVKALKNRDEGMLLAAPGHFTSAGHYIAVRGVTKSGKVILDDPNGKGKYGDSERKSGWSGSQLKAAAVIDYRVLHLKSVK